MFIRNVWIRRVEKISACLLSRVLLLLEILRMTKDDIFPLNLINFLSKQTESMSSDIIE